MINIANDVTPPSSPPRTAVIVGATGGIGAAAARDLHARGFSLILNGRREGLLRELAEEVNGTYVCGDANDELVISALVDSAPDGIDVLVHAAGVLKGEKTRTQSIATFDEVLAINLRSAYVLVHLALPKLKVGSRIILVSSLSATLPMRGLTAYSASKAGMNAFATALGAELERDGINVSLASPGVINTPMMDDSANAFAGLPSSDAGAVIGWLAELPPRIVIPDILFRAPFSGPFAEKIGGTGSQGERLKNHAEP